MSTLFHKFLEHHDFYFIGTGVGLAAPTSFGDSKGLNSAGQCFTLFSASQPLARQERHMPLEILWSPSVVLADRLIRIPVRSDTNCRLEPGPARLIQTSPRRDGITRFFLRTPAQSGPLTLRFTAGSDRTEITLTVVSFAACRTLHRRLDNVYPRRWPLGEPFTRTKTGPTLDPEAAPPLTDPEWDLVRRWMARSDRETWNALPPAETPRCYTVNEIQGCPRHGTELFKFGGFYPWRHDHFQYPDQLLCPVGDEPYPSNAYDQGDFLSGAFPDDGYGYTDEQGHRFHFIGAQTWPRIRHFLQGIHLLGRACRRTDRPADLDADSLLDRWGFMMVRFAAEELYLAAVPQFRFGNLKDALKEDQWGPAETAGLPYPHHYTVANGTQEYCISQAGVAAGLAAQYDALYSALKANPRLFHQFQPFGLELAGPDDVLQVIEEMFACFIQHHLDGYNRTNHPGASGGTLICLRVLNSPRLADIMAYLYDDSEDQLRTLIPNGFYPDGVGYEATGGYSAGHVMGAFKIQDQVEALRQLQPDALPVDRFPPLNTDRRFQLMADPFRSTVYCGRTAMLYGDDREPGALCEGIDRSTADLKKPFQCATGWVPPAVFAREAFRHHPTSPLWAAALADLNLAGEFPGVQPLLARQPSATAWPPVLLEHGGIGILRLRRPDGRDRVAVGHHFISQPFHRHDDFMDAQLVAFDRVWLYDLGYPATHDTCWYWEGSWPVHNRGHILDGQDEDIVGSGRCTLFIDSPACAAIATEGVEGQFQDWRYWTPTPNSIAACSC
jgi:hypothetical protein